MKTIMLTILVGLSLQANAKLSDFNTLIEENSKAQTDLHTDLKQKLDETKIAVQNEQRDRFLVDNSATINVPTKKEFLTYSKEKVYYRASQTQAQKRLAQEIDSAE